MIPPPTSSREGTWTMKTVYELIQELAHYDADALVEFRLQISGEFSCDWCGRTHEIDVDVTEDGFDHVGYRLEPGSRLVTIEVTQVEGHDFN